MISLHSFKSHLVKKTMRNFQKEKIETCFPIPNVMVNLECSSIYSFEFEINHNYLHSAVSVDIAIKSYCLISFLQSPYIYFRSRHCLRHIVDNDRMAQPRQGHPIGLALDSRY